MVPTCGPQLSSGYRIMSTSFSFRILDAQTWDINPDNVDVGIELSDGRQYWATFFTLQNIESLFQKNRRTGECAGGAYLWAVNMVIVENLELDTIRKSIEDLISTGEIDGSCHRIM
jgi:hypothetical protein